MAIINTGDFPIDPTQTSGTELADRLNREFAAVMSSNANPSRPNYITAGGVWAKTTGTKIEFMLFDGANDFVLGAVDAGVQGLQANRAYFASPFPATPIAGDLFYDSDDQYFYVYDGGAWKQIGLTALTAAAADNDTSVATTAFVKSMAGTYFQAYDAQLSSLIRQNAQAMPYSCLLTDGGKQIKATSAGICTIPANSSVAFAIGTAISFDNDVAGILSVAIGGTDTLILAGVGAKASINIAQYGYATAIKTGSTTWKISGVGVS